MCCFVGSNPGPIFFHNSSFWHWVQSHQIYSLNVLALDPSYSVRMVCLRRELKWAWLERCAVSVLWSQPSWSFLLGVSFERPSLGQREGLRVLSDGCSVGHNDRRALARGPFISSFLPSAVVYIIFYWVGRRRCSLDVRDWKQGKHSKFIYWSRGFLALSPKRLDFF